MGMMPPVIKHDADTIPEFETQYVDFVPELADSEDAISFSGSSDSYCIGIVDMVNSTKIAATLPDSMIGKYYSIFLNTMSSIVRRYGGIVVKNVGDSLLYYFPETSDPASKNVFMQCLECGLFMIAAHGAINKTLHDEGMPSVDYRVSIDYGKVMMAKSSNSSCEDIFGPPVNTCAKINCKAAPNTIVIGGDLYQIVKDLSCFHFKEVQSYSFGFPYPYPIYSVLCTKTKCVGMS